MCDIGQNMPWIVALLIGLLSVLITYLNMRMTRQSIDRQLTLTKEIAQLDFNKTVISGNRQQWINKLRDQLSQYLAKLDTFFASNHLTESELTILSEEITALETNISLMLNHSEEKSKELNNSLSILTQHMKGTAITQPKEVLMDRVMAAASAILKEEWERVKKGE